MILYADGTIEANKYERKHQRSKRELRSKHRDPALRCLGAFARSIRGRRGTRSRGTGRTSPRTSAQCSMCSAALDRERELVSLLAAEHAEPDAALLASCRAGLQDALDRGEERGWLHRTLASFLPSSFLSPRPAWSAAVLLLIGFSVGVLGPALSASSTTVRRSHQIPTPRQGILPRALLRDDSSASSTGASSAAVSSAGASNSPLPALDWRSADVAGINLVDSGRQRRSQCRIADALRAARHCERRRR